MTSIGIHHVSKTLGVVQVLQGFSLEVAEAARLVVLGESGSGKTTLLRLIAGLETPDEGEILLDGQPASRSDWILPPHQRNIGMVFQSPVLWPHMTVTENICFGASKLSRQERQRRSADLLSALGLDRLSRRYPHELSGGEARRVGLARALAPHPRLLLMDEPLTNLNPELVELSLAVIRAHLEATRPTLVYVTHDAQEAAAISSQVIRLAKRSVA